MIAGGFSNTGLLGNKLRFRGSKLAELEGPQSPSNFLGGCDHNVWVSTAIRIWGGEFVELQKAGTRAQNAT